MPIIVAVSRFRLRFLLQEFDLPPGETLIGRSPDCHITIEDPLISRQHARIVVSGGKAVFVDLASRNGSRVNGRPVAGSQELADSDRIRLGAQELVFVKVETDQRHVRSTGAMRLCSRCKTPFPEGPPVCPHCGHAVTAVREEDTVNGISVPMVRRSWILQMLADGIEKAVRASKATEAQRMLKRAAEEIEDRVAAGEVESAAMVRVTDLALRISRIAADPQWAVWAVDIHRRAARVPAESTVKLIEMALSLPGVGASLQRLVESFEGGGEPCDEVDAPQLARLEEVCANPSLAVGEEEPEPAAPVDAPTQLPPPPADRRRSGVAPLHDESPPRAGSKD